MKTINVDFLSNKETIFGLIIGYIYDEIKDLPTSPIAFNVIACAHR